MKFHIVACLGLCMPTLVHAAQQCSLPPDAPGFAVAETASTSNIQNPQVAPHPAQSARFLSRLTEAGAQVLDFGMVHGLRLVGARNGQEFRVFSMLPDGSAAVEGAPLAMSVDQLTRLAANDITQLGRVAGFDGLFVRSGGHFQVFYSSPDGEAVVPGILRDAEGKNLTRQQMQGVPGAIPTVELQDGPTSIASVDSSPEPSLAAIQKAAFGTIGSGAAPEVFMIIDPQCVYSVRAYQQLQPYAAAGKIRLSLVPVSILDHEDQGRSTLSALALLSKAPGEIPTSWQRGETSGPSTPEGQDRLAGNMAIATSIGLKGTPTLIWKSHDGKALRIDGVPTDIGALITSVGG